MDLQQSTSNFTDALSNESNKVSNQTYFEPDSSTQVNLGLAIFFVLYTIVGVLGNLAIILIICAKEALRKSFYMYIWNVSVADFLLCAICGTFNALIQFTGEQRKACMFMGTVLTMTLIASIVSLSAVAINRCHLLRLSHKRYKTLYSKMRTILSLVIIWVISVIGTSPLVFGYLQATIDSRIQICSAIVRDVYSYFYSVFIVLLIGFPCTIIIIISYVCIWRIFRQSLSRQIRHKTQQQHRRFHDSFRLSRNLFLISTTFVLCWLPEMVVIVIDYDVQLPGALHSVTILLALSHSVVHPILCITLNRNISQALREILTCVFSCHSTQTQKHIGTNETHRQADQV